MCGLAGIFSHKGITQSDLELVERMNDLQRHRGPDDEGMYVDKYCVLGHRRLAIIDLSKDGHQPFNPMIIGSKLFITAKSITTLNCVKSYGSLAGDFEQKRTPKYF